MSELVECQVCHFHNPSDRKQKRERCEGCDGSLDDAVPVELAVAGSTAADTAAGQTEQVQDQPGAGAAFCDCLFPVSAPAICRTCGLPGRSSTDDAATVQARPNGPDIREENVASAAHRYRLRYGRHASLGIETGLLIGRGYAGVPPDFADWLGQRQGISRRHCLLQVVGGDFSITDLGTTNGTTVSGVPIAPGLPHRVAADRFPLTIGLGNHASVTIERYEDTQ